MSNIAATYNPSLDSEAPPSGLRLFVWPALLIWFLASFSLASRGAFLSAPGKPPLALLLAVLTPIAVFLVLFGNWPAFRSFVLQRDLRLLVATQAWRFGGLGFITINTLGLLPPYFAWPAGLGDAVVGATAPFMVLSLVKDPRFVASRRFVSWNIFGIFDFAVLAVGSGALFPQIFPDLAREMTTPAMIAADPIQHLPMVLIPTFLVPLFTIFHLTALFQARGARRAATSH